MTLKIGVLHGARQSAEIIMTYLGSLQKMLSSVAKKQELQLLALDAPHDHRDGGLQWFPNHLEIELIGKYRFEEIDTTGTLDYVEDWIKTNGIEVLVGFSQGSNVIDTLLRHRELPQIKRVVMFSGYSFVEESPKPITCPVMTVCSEKDDIVPSIYDPVAPDKKTLHHDKGHRIPQSKPLLREIATFIVQ